MMMFIMLSCKKMKTLVKQTRGAREKGPTCTCKLDEALLYTHMSRAMRFPTMWYVQPAKTQTSLNIRAV